MIGYRNSGIRSASKNLDFTKAVQTIENFNTHQYHQKGISQQLFVIKQTKEQQKQTFINDIKIELSHTIFNNNSTNQLSIPQSAKTAHREREKRGSFFNIKYSDRDIYAKQKMNNTVLRKPS